MSRFPGVITAMVTPFGEDGEVDLRACARVARYLLEHGSDGLVLCGTTGESPTLSDSEKLAVLRAVRDELGPDVQLILGSGSNDTRHSVELTAAGDEAGADAFLVVTPYYNRPNPAGIEAHFEAVAAATPKPIVVYNIPSRCVINIPPDGLARLARIDNVLGVKQANDDQLTAVEGLEILAGNDGTFLRCLEEFGTGGILVASHLAGPQMAEIRSAVDRRELDRARELDAELHPLYEMIGLTSNPIPVKTALEMLGICSARMRLPLVPADDDQREQIRSTLDRYGFPAAG